MELKDMSLETFASALASTEPTPGGGGAAALVGALSAALCSMAGGITLQSKRYAARKDSLSPILSRCEELRERLLELIDEDARLFLPLKAAYSMPKDDPDYGRTMENATLGACRAPLEMLRLCAELSGLLRRLSENCSPMLVSDVGCAAHCCRAAMECAAMNVFINTRSLLDRDKALKIENEVRSLLSENGAEATAVGKKIAEGLACKGHEAMLMRGAPVAAAADAETKKRVQRLGDTGVTPTIALVRVGSDPDAVYYEKSASERCERLGVAVRKVTLPQSASQTELMSAIRGLNIDAGVHGILLLLPLPEGFDEKAVCAEIAADKDVDGVSPGSAAGIYSGTGEGFAPCTAEACMMLLHHYGIPVSGAKAVVVGRSLIAGRPVSMLLTQEDATVTLCHSKTQRLAEVVREADIVIAAVGKGEFLGGDCFRAGQTVIDVGTNYDADGRLVGDVCFAQASRRVRAITPVPQGVGAVTAAVLAMHTVLAAERLTGKQK